MAKLRFKLIYEGEYEVDPGRYGFDDPETIASIERECIEVDPEEWLLCCEYVDKTTVEVSPVEG